MRLKRRIVVLSLFFALLVPAVLAQAIDLVRALQPLTGLNIGRVYEIHYVLIDFALISMISIGIARSKLGEQFKGGEQAITALGLIMGAIFAFFEYRQKQMVLAGLWPLVILMIIVLVVRVVLAAAAKDRLWAGISLLLLWGILNGGPWNNITQIIRGWFPLWDLIWTAIFILALFLIITGISQFWQATGGPAGEHKSLGERLFGPKQDWGPVAGGRRAGANNPNRPATQGNQPNTQGNQPNTQGNQPNTQGNQPNTQGNQPNTQGAQQPEPPYSPQLHAWMARFSASVEQLVRAERELRRRGRIVLQERNANNAVGAPPPATLIEYMMNFNQIYGRPAPPPPIIGIIPTINALLAEYNANLSDVQGNFEQQRRFRQLMNRYDQALQGAATVPLVVANNYRRGLNAVSARAALRDLSIM